MSTLSGGPNIVTNGLVLNLDAANTKSYPGSGTTWTDISRGGNNGTLVNGPTFDSANGGSIIFDGVDDYFQLSSRTTNTEFQYSSTFSIECFVKITENTNYGYLVTNRALTDGSGVSYTGWGILQNAGTLSTLIGGYPSSTYDWRNVNITTSDFTTYVYNKWTHIVWTNNGVQGGGKLYINSIDRTYQSYDDNTPPYTINYNGNHKITLGMSPADGAGGGQFLSSNIANVKIYNRTLSATEILQNFNATKTRFGL